MEKYESYDAYMAALEKRGQLPEGFRTAVLPLSFFPEERKLIKEQVLSLRSAIIDGSISKIYFWYVHNLNESNNPTVSKELKIMASSSNALVKSNFPGNEIEIFAIEVALTLRAVVEKLPSIVISTL